MSYESRFENEYKNYKVDFIELLDEVEEGRLPILPDMRAELDVVYAQAAKADEYESKAKAWDTMKKDFEDIADTPMGQQILLNMSIIKERVEMRDANA